MNTRLSVAAVVALVAGGPAAAAPIGIGFDTSEICDYLIISTNEQDGNTDVAMNNFELGANKAPVPSDTDFINSGGGPTLKGAVPDLPSGIATIFQGIGFDGNIAVMDRNGEIELQDVGVYANPNIGIRLAGTQARNKSSNSFFNDPNSFPNTYVPQPGNIGGGSGIDVNPNDAVQSTRIDPDGTPGSAGVTYGFDFTSLQNQLDVAESFITNAVATSTLDLAGDGGKISSDLRIDLQDGLNIIDIATGGNDFLIENSNLVIDGSEDAIAIFRLQGDDNMLISNANVLAGDGGIGLNNILFFAGEGNEGSNFSFSNTILNGVAFWSLGNEGEIDISNAQGSTQLIADIVDLDNVRFTRSKFAPSSFIPTPGTALVLGLSGLVMARRRR